MQMSQDDLAKLIGVSGRQVRRYENGDAKPPLAVGLKWAEVLEIAPSKLVLLLSTIK